MAAIIDGSTYKGFWELTGLPNDEVNNIGILIA